MSITDRNILCGLRANTHPQRMRNFFLLFMCPLLSPETGKQHSQVFAQVLVESPQCSRGVFTALVWFVLLTWHFEVRKKKEHGGCFSELSADSYDIIRQL